MYDSYSRYTLEKESQARRQAIFDTVAHDKMVKSFKATQTKAPATSLLRQRLGRSLVKLGEWCASPAQLKEV
jgi:hypothetical protein